MVLNRAALAVVASLSLTHCTRHGSRDPAPPHVTPTTEPRSQAAPAAPTPPPPQPACVLASGASEVVAGIHGGRIDGLKLAAVGASARLNVDVVQSTGREWYAVTLALGATPLAHADPAVVANPADDDSTPSSHLSAAVTLGGALLTVAQDQVFAGGGDGSSDDGDGTSDDGDGGGHLALLGGPRPLGAGVSQRADELVASGDGSDFLVAYVGTDYECMAESGTCTTLGAGSRLTEQEMNATHPYGDRAYGAWIAGPPDAQAQARDQPFAMASVIVTRCDHPPHTRDGRDNPAFRPTAVPPNCRAAHRLAPDAIAVAYHRGGSAVAYRAGGALWIHGVSDALHAGPAIEIARGQVGAPALAFQGDRFWMVWAQRDAASAPYTLRYASIAADVAGAADAGTVAPEVHALATGTAPAFAPGLAVHGDVLVLTWTEGDAHASTTRLGASRGGLDHVLDHAIALSHGAVNARDSEVTWPADGDRGWVAWAEYPGRELTDGVVRVAPLRIE